MIGNPIELFRLLNAHKVKYLIIGGMAAITYGVPRVTKDIDLLIQADATNCRRLLDAFLAARMGTADLTTPEAILQNEISIFDDYWRIDVLTRLKTLTFDELWERRNIVERSDVALPMISLQDLIADKLATARPGDLDDAKILQTVADESDSPDKN